jgi:hypothetical protein
VFKAMNNAEKYEWYKFLHEQSGAQQRRRDGGEPASELVEAGQEFDVEEVLSRLEIYASLVSFRVQRKFIHILQAPRYRDPAHLKSLVQTMVGLSVMRVRRLPTAGPLCPRSD